MNSEDFWTVFLIVLAAALLWIVFNVFWDHNEHRPNIDLGIHEHAPVNSGGYRYGDASAVDARKASFHRTGLALSLRPSARESSLTSPVAKIRGEGYVLLPFGLASFLGGVFLTAFVVWRVVSNTATVAEIGVSAVRKTKK